MGLVGSGRANVWICIYSGVLVLTTFLPMVLGSPALFAEGQKDYEEFQKKICAGIVPPLTEWQMRHDGTYYVSRKDGELYYNLFCFRETSIKQAVFSVLGAIACAVGVYFLCKLFGPESPARPMGIVFLVFTTYLFTSRLSFGGWTVVSVLVGGFHSALLAGVESLWATGDGFRATVDALVRKGNSSSIQLLWRKTERQATLCVAIFPVVCIGLAWQVTSWLTGAYMFPALRRALIGYPVWLVFWGAVGLFGIGGRHLVYRMTYIMNRLSE